MIRVCQPLKERYDAFWQDLPVSPTTRPSEGASLRIYKALYARPVDERPRGQDHLQAGFVKQVCASLSQIQNGQS